VAIPRCIETDLMTTAQEAGRDELNLAEFPLGALATRLRPGQKTLRFTDQVRDESRGETITRELTITGTDAHGLPTTLDDEVLLGLIQLTRLHGFVDRKVPFTRYQLIALLGWRDETRSYERLAASLTRWTGVTLHYRNAWWHKPRRCWVDETFHVLDNVWLCHRRGVEAPGSGSTDERPLSAFVWNEVLFRSFQAGNLKAIDFEFFEGLDSAVARRLYRFLDKRFFHRPQWEFDLQELAWEHVGLSRSYDTASLKRKLRPALGELEAKGFLEPAGEPDRFWRAGTGQWRVALARRTSAAPVMAAVPATSVPLVTAAATETAAATQPAATTTDDPLVSALVERGVTRTAARRTVRRFAAERIAAQVEVFDWLVARADSKVARNPPGFLVRAIQEAYEPPREFVSRAEAARRAEATAQRRRQREATRQARATRREREELARSAALEAFWESLPTEERARREAEALAAATPLQRSLLAGGGRAAVATRQALLDACARVALSSRVQAAGTG